MPRRSKSTPPEGTRPDQTVHVSRSGEDHWVTPEVAGILKRQGWSIEGADYEELEKLRAKVADLETQLEGAASAGEATGTDPDNPPAPGDDQAATAKEA